MTQTIAQYKLGRYYRLSLMGKWFSPFFCVGNVMTEVYRRVRNERNIKL
jgi:hypothetical protein